MNNRGLLGKLAIVGIGGCLLLAITSPSFVRAQSSATEDWEKAAGGKMSFDVASVKQNKPGFPPGGDPRHTNIPLGQSDAYSPTGGLILITNYPLSPLIGFAYKLDSFEGNAMHGKLPNWAAGGDHFDIEARGPANATQDQMRLMMQSLLADRFKLVAHFETHDEAIYDLVLAKPGQTGPQLTPYSDARPCVDPARPTPPAANSAPSVPCGAFIARDMPDGGIVFSASRVTIQQIADNWAVLSPANINRLVVDRTGLRGYYDYSLNFPKGMWRAGVSVDEPEPSFGELLKEQLGLKLKSATGPVRSLIIDHIEEPSPN
jgi:bla regulator protein blaR1